MADSANAQVPVQKLVNIIYSFCELYGNRHLFPYQEQFARRLIRSVLLNDGAEITALFSRQSGKCFAKDTEILMSDGTVKKVQDIKVGDCVMRPNGFPARVLSLGRGKEEMFEVRSREKNHESFTVNKSHILSVIDRKGKVHNISVSDYLKLPTWKRNDEYRGYRVAVDYSEKFIPVDPYFLGLWIGDGSSRDSRITNVDSEVIRYLYEYAEEIGLRVSRYTTKNRVTDFAITNGNIGGANGGAVNPIVNYLKSQDMIGNKHIPDDIMLNSRNVRLEFLAGLIDSDGHHSKCAGKENTLELTSKDKGLALQYVRLLRSLGYRASMKEHETICRGNKFKSFRVNAYGDFSVVPIKIARKKYVKTVLRENPLTFGFDLIPKGIDDYYGFTIDSEDHLFLLGDYTVVHNTETVALVVGGLMIFLPTLAKLPMFANDSRLAPYKNGIMIGIYAPTLRQAQINYNRMRSFLTSDSALEVLNDQDFKLTFDTNNGNTVRLSNGSYASAVSASEGSNIEGESHHLIICEEAQDISDMKITKSIHPMGAAYNATMVLVGTATTFVAYFYRTIQRNIEEMKLRGIGTPKAGSLDRLHFEYDCDTASKYNPRYKKYVDGERKKLGEKSDAFQMSYKLKWIISRGMLVDIAQFERDNTEKYQDIVDCDMVATHVIGIDIGGAEGGDSTVLTAVEVNWDMPVVREKKFDEEAGEEIEYVAYNTYIKSWLELQNIPDYEEQYYIIKDFISQFNTVRVVVDATREKGLSDRLAATLSCEVVPYVFTAKSKSDLYSKFIGELSTARARIPFGQKTIQTAECQKFLQQLGDMQKSYRGSYVVCSHSDARNAHDDYVDSWALAIWGASYEGETSRVESHDKRSLFKEFTNRNFQRKTNMLTARRRR